MLRWILLSTAWLATAQVQRVSPRYGHDFEFPLPIMPVKEPLASYTNETTGTTIDFFEVRVQPFTKRLFPDLQDASLIGYDGIEPGPTFRVTKGREAVVRVVNEMFRPAAVHLHGSYTFDGWAEDVIAPGEYKDYYYPNGQPRTLWYHDHAVGITSLNIYAGLTGMYIVEDPELEARFDLPRGDYDIPLILQSRRYTSTGNITNETSERRSTYGDTFSVNGQILPHLTVEPRKYRFRILNAAASRTFNLTLEVSSGAGRLPFHVVASDGGFMARPVQTSSLVVAMAERWEVVVDFSGLADGANVTMRQANCFVDTEYVGSNRVMQFRVRGEATSEVGNGPLPSALVQIPTLRDRAVDKTFVFGGVAGTWTINGRTFGDVANRILRNVPRGTTEKWELQGGIGWSHPIHLHLVDFVILSRSILPGLTVGRTAVTEYESVALKDVVAIGNNEAVTILAKYAPWDGVYMFHCHNTVHEDHDMMAVFNVTALANFGYPESTRFEDPMEARFRAQPYDGPATPEEVQNKLAFFSSLSAYYNIPGVEKALDEYWNLTKRGSMI